MYGAESGGSQSARILQSSIVQFMAERYPGQQACLIKAHVYADLKALSNDVFLQSTLKSKPQLPRALGGFAAGFSRDEHFFDFVDVADESAVERKIIGKVLLSIFRIVITNLPRIVHNVRH